MMIKNAARNGARTLKKHNHWLICLVVFLINTEYLFAGPKETQFNKCADQVQKQFLELSDIPKEVAVLKDIEQAVKESVAGEKTYTCENIQNCNNGHLQGITKLSQPESFFIAGTSESDTSIGFNLHVVDLLGLLFQNYNSRGQNSKEEHTDGIQAVGQYVFVPTNQVSIYQIQELSPKLPLKPIATVDLKEHLSDVGAVAVAKIQSGPFSEKYVMAVGFQELSKIGLYISSITDPNATSRDWGFDLIGLDLGRGQKKYTWSIQNRTNYQSINFITECETNRLFLLGLGRNGDGNRNNFNKGKNIADLFLVGELKQSKNGTPLLPSLTFLSSKIFEPIHSDFAGAAGSHVNPEGMLEIYSTTIVRLPPHTPLQIEMFSKK